MNRDEAFGRLLAIANVLSQRVYEEDKVKVSEKHLSRFSKKPALTFEKIHSGLMEYADKFGSDEIHLLDMFGEILSEMDVSDFSNEPLNTKYIHSYHIQQHALDNVIGVDEAAILWGISAGTIKNYCAEGKIIAKKIGKTWIIDKNQPNPSQKGEVEMKTLKIEVSKKFDHIIGQEVNEVYEVNTKNDVKSYIGDIIENLDLEVYEDHEDEIKSIYNLENGTHIIDSGDFIITVEIGLNIKNIDHVSIKELFIPILGKCVSYDNIRNEGEAKFKIEIKPLNNDRTEMIEGKKTKYWFENVNALVDFDNNTITVDFMKCWNGGLNEHITKTYSMKITKMNEIETYGAGKAVEFTVSAE